ncbi:MAG: glycine--tRNA ligase subunit beta, partial [bacterium]
AEVKEKGKNVRDLLGDIFTELIRSLDIPRPMYWEETKFVFSRPIRWIVALLDEEIIPFKLAGIESNRYTYGHRFLSSGKIYLKNAKEYKEKLENAYVIFDHNKRKRYILETVDKLTEDLNVQPLLTEELLNEVTFLVEYPYIILGNFSEYFLELPSEVLTTVMVHHQRYIPIKRKTGMLYPGFIIVSNMGQDAIANIKKGNERVISARFDDAKFFYDRDTSIPLRERVKDLSKISLPGTRGTLRDKVERMNFLLSYLIDVLSLSDRKKDLEDALILSETDRTTEMAKEFPELHGIIGGIYARLTEEETIWRAIYHHEEANPDDFNAKLLAIVERMYDIVSSFNEGYVPSGSQDPYGLRKEAYNLVYLLGESNIDVELSSLMDILNAKDKKEIWTFISQRVYNYLVGKGIRRDLVESSLGLDTTSVSKITNTAVTLQELSTQETFPQFVTAAVRCFRITRELEDLPICNPSYFETDDERSLYEFINNVNLDGDMSLKKRYERLLPLVEILERFFKNVFVMVDDERIRINRLSLLKNTYRLFSPFGDLTRVEER